MDISALDTLENFAKKTNRSFEKFEDVIPATAMNRLSRSKRWVIINDKEGALYFGYDNSGGGFTHYDFFAGIAFPVNMLMKDFKLKLDAKDVLDRINIFKKFPKTYDKELDKLFVFESNDLKTAVSIFDDRKIRQLIKDLFKDQAFSIDINRINFTGIPPLKEKDFVCIHKREWLFDEDIIENLFQLTYKLTDRLKEIKICE